jgi:outer membrane protein assembly factor BamB
MRYLLVVACVLLAACSRQPARQSAPKQQAAAPPSTQLLYGGDAHAWLGQLGNIQDQSYCHARLKLPLNPKPAWEHDYTGAEFSGSWPTTILNYNGTLTVCAQSPQLMLMRATSGEVIENKDVYQRESTFSGQLEAFVSIYLTPAGRLLAVDATNSFYCFDTRQLAPVWFRRTPRTEQGASALVADIGNLYCNWGSARSWNPHSISVADGKPGWVYGVGADPDDLGVTLSRSGTMLLYARPNQLRAIRVEDGKPMWSSYASGEISLAPIDEQRQLVYTVLYNESLDCRDLRTGQLRWSYSWRDLLSENERESRMQLAGLRRLTRQPLEVLSTGICVGDDGVYLSLQTGDVLHLSAEGKLLWKVRLDAPVAGMVLFDNALLAAQQYQVPDILEKGREMSQAVSQDAFNLRKPNWSNLTPSQNVRHARFTRFAALSRSNGAMLSTVDTAVTNLSNLCPAGSAVVFGGTRRGEGLRAQVNYITAYSWVEQ